MGVQRGPNVITDGLVACWDFSSKQCYPGSGSTCYDIVGKNTGTLSTPTFVNDGGKSALRFDYTNSDMMTFQDTPQLSFGTGDFSIEAWILCKQASVGSNPGSKYAAPIVLGDKNGMALFLPADPSLYSTHWRGQIMVEGITRCLTDNLLINTWYHIACTRTGASGTNTGKYTYVNGGDPQSRNGDGNWVSGSGIPDAQMGRGYTTYYFDGDIAIVRVYNRVLTPAEVKSSYDKTKGRFQ